MNKNLMILTLINFLEVIDGRLKIPTVWRWVVFVVADQFLDLLGGEASLGVGIVDNAVSHTLFVYLKKIYQGLE